MCVNYVHPRKTRFYLNKQTETTRRRRPGLCPVIPDHIVYTARINTTGINVGGTITGHTNQGPVKGKKNNR